MPPAPPPLSTMRQEIGTLRPALVRALALSVFASLLSLAPSLYMLEVYDRVVNSRNLTTLAMLTLWILGTLAVMEVLEWVRLQILRQAGEKLDARLGQRVFDAVFQICLRRGQTANMQPFNDLRTLREFFASPAVLAVMETPVAAVLLVLLYLIHPWLAFLALAGAVIQTWIAWLTQRRTHAPLAAANGAAQAAQSYATQCLRNAQIIESMGMLRSIHARWVKRQHEFLFQQAVASDHAGVLAAVARALQLTLSSALLGLGCWLILQHMLIDGGALMIIASILGGRLLQPIVQLVTHWKQVEEARGALGRLDELLQTLPPSAERMSLPAPRGALSVEAVTAGAPGSPLPILHNVSFALSPGECLAVIGPSASGKTTLARLITGLWPAAVGKVRLDGADVFRWNKTELGPHLGYLPQDVELFDGTLAENVARFGEVDRAAVAAACELVGLDDLIAELPDGLDSRIGDEGALLSGGQRQRVGLARAIYGAPRLIVLDEPNSNLDERGEAALLKTLQHLKARGATVIVITHRTHILAAADKLLLLVNGSVQAFGPREQVLAALAKARSAPAPAATPSPPRTATPLPSLARSV